MVTEKGIQNENDRKDFTYDNWVESLEWFVDNNNVGILESTPLSPKTG